MDKQPPKPDKSEERRVANYEKRRQELAEQGYTEHIGVISVLRANVMVFVTAGPLALLVFVLYLLRWGEYSHRFALAESLLFILLMIVSIPIHEVLHGLAWSLCCREGWKSIYIGVMWNKLTPFCNCMEPLNRRSYLFGALAPLVVLGILPGCASLLWQSPLILLLSAYNILAAGGDTTISLMLRKYKGALFLDHPTECGFAAFRK
jgi:hypothetical protein